MGGNALSFETRRVNHDEYFHLVNDIRCKLNSIGEEKHIDIPAYRTKPDFGDIDILIVSDRPNRKEWIQKLFEPKEIYHNSDCFSFDYYGVQVDFIFCKEENFVTSYNYFSWNDLGNICGRIFHRQGLRFGHDGLTLIVRDDTQVVGEILLSKDINQILEFGGYDPVRFAEGFDTLEDIFKFASSTPYYNYEIFDLDNRNYRARTRDRKRPTYTKFLLWAQENMIETGYEWNSNKAAYLPRILYEFGKLDEYTEMLRRHFVNLDIKKKFNGEIVMKLTGLSGKELGAFMTAFKTKFSRDDMSKMTAGMIREELLREYATDWF